MSDEDFETFLDGCYAHRTGAPGDSIPTHTALWAARDTVTATGSPVHELLALRQQGVPVDWSQLH
jgi:hypothetical protein